MRPGHFLKLLKRTLEKYGKLDSETIYKVMLEEMIPGKLTYGYADGAIMMKEYKFSEEMYPDPGDGCGPLVHAGHSVQGRQGLYHLSAGD